MPAARSGSGFVRDRRGDDSDALSVAPGSADAAPAKPLAKPGQGPLRQAFDAATAMTKRPTPIARKRTRLSVCIPHLIHVKRNASQALAAACHRFLLILINSRRRGWLHDGSRPEDHR